MVAWPRRAGEAMTGSGEGKVVEWGFHRREVRAAVVHGGGPNSRDYGLEFGVRDEGEGVGEVSFLGEILKRFGEAVDGARAVKVEDGGAVGAEMVAREMEMRWCRCSRGVKAGVACDLVWRRGKGIIGDSE
ncbi:unnamed protein product [Sphenostylis stenocarpa]|uniref:Uncharacterized protein n=1 Tax=Sphenostylis stenocarpa TaxID=92480 RepID=A0AA86TA88_9FABA|nr:unnamed protein product [Sphenostylis stenocarpa]